MDLYHATDLHITWRYTCHSGKLRYLKLLPWRKVEAHTRLTVEALVDWFKQKRDQGDLDWHLVITGDITDTGSQLEMQEAKKILDPIWDPNLLSVVPGNHDLSFNKFINAYGKEEGLPMPKNHKEQQRLFNFYFGELMVPLKDFPCDFPCLKLLPKQKLALVLLNSVIETDKADGEIGKQQLECLRSALDWLQKSPETCEWPVVVALHHSPLDDFDSLMCLRDSDQLLLACRGRVSAVVNGHIHSYRVRWNSGRRSVRVFQAKSTALPRSITPVARSAKVPLNRYRFYDGRLQYRGDVGTFSVSLANALTMRQKKWRDRYAPEFGPTHTCDACGNLVASEMIVCPWCGEETDFSKSSTSVCYQCYQPVLPVYDYCPMCRAPRGSTEEGGLGNAATKQCRGCERAVGLYHWYCPWCSINQDPPKVKKDTECYYCKWPADSNVYLYCPWCGIEL